MPKLNQIIAIEKGIKNKVQQELTAAHHGLQKGELLSGISRVYSPKDDDGERFPSERKLVQIKTDESLAKTAAILTSLFDITATKDTANQSARADVVVDGKVIAKQLPVSTLLFLEKQLNDVNTLVKKLPLLDPGEEWAWDDTAGAWATHPTETVKTKKIPRNHVKADPTKEHPAQVEVYMEDVLIGYWKTVKFSGAVPMARAQKLLDRVEKLQRAVKFAREEANTIEAPSVKIGADIFGYMFE